MSRVMSLKIPPWWMLFFASGLVLLIGLPYLRTFGQQKESPVVTKIRRAYENLEYRRARQLAEEALREYSSYTPEELVEIYKYLAFVAFSEGHTEEARQHFRSLLSLQPNYQLDSLYTSPKILRFYREIKEQWQQGGAPIPRPEIRYLVLQDPRPAAALRSALLPGWGQLYKGEKTKGWVLMGAAGSIVVGWWAIDQATDNAHERYLRARIPQDIEKAYQSYNRWYKLRKAWIGMAIVLWLYSYLDAALKPVSPSAPAQVKLQTPIKLSSPSLFTLTFALSLK